MVGMGGVAVTVCWIASCWINDGPDSVCLSALWSKGSPPNGFNIVQARSGGPLNGRSMGMAVPGLRLVFLSMVIAVSFTALNAYISCPGVSTDQNTLQLASLLLFSVVLT